MSTTEAYFEKFVDSLFVSKRDGTEGYLHAATGLSGESGEVLDLIKKVWVYDRPLDVVTYDKLIEEMGDTLHYLQMLCIKMRCSMGDLRDHNVAKLRARYPDGFSKEAANARADKAGQ
jgi:NTP pyrophosphatase (non-canonical NTP hydrolase)